MPLFTVSSRLVSKYSPKRIAVAELNRKFSRTYILERVWVLLEKIEHFREMRREVPGVIDIITSEAPGDNSSERPEIH